jgi:uncharacterized membrane protein
MGGPLYFINVTIHVMAAMLWIGGMFFFALVGAPALREVEPPQMRARLFATLGRRFRKIGWIAIAILLLTGVGNLYFRGLLTSDAMFNVAFWQTRYGHTLAWKLTSVLAMLVVSAIHDFVSGPRASRAPAGSDEALRLRIHAARLARINAIIGLIVVIAAVRLARGG